MFFHELELHRCKRFPLMNGETLRISPSLKTQMVLGTNGAGKSSLLRIGFTVMPPDAKDFKKGGFKSIRLSHNGRMYTLKTIFEKASPEHVFIVDDEDLNKGGTGAVQRELIREHFGMTQEIDDVLTGATRFTSMSPVQRREWITRLSDTDFGYVLDLYARIKKGARDAAAVVKHNTNRLAVESAKLMDETEVLTLVNRSSTLRQELEVLLQECGTHNESPDFIGSKLGELYVDLDRQIKQTLKSSRFWCPDGYSFRNMESLLSEIQMIKNKVIADESVLNELYNVFHEIEHSMQSLKTIEGMDEDYIRTQIRDCVQQMEALTNKIQTDEPVDSLYQENYGQALMHVEEFKSLIYSISTELVDTYPEDLVNQRRARMDHLHESRRILTSKVSNIEGRLTHIDSCSETTCPKCSHSFKAGVGENERETLKATLATAASKEQLIETEMQEIREYVQEATKFHRQIQEIHQLRQRTPYLANFWGYVDRLGGIMKGRELVPFVGRYINDLVTANDIHAIKAKYNILSESISTIEALAGESKGIRERYHDYKARITDVTVRIDEEKTKLRLLDEYLQQQMRLDAQCTRIEQSIDEIAKYQESLIEAIRQNEIRGLVKEQQISLAMIESTLTEVDVQEGIVKDIRNEIATVSLEEKAYKLLTDLLSPNDGLIAEQIGLFINVIIDRINSVIAKIWGYNLALKPCDMSEGNLDYKFPLYSVAEDNTAPDISFGSDSQVDIVNQAFRLVVYRFLGLNGYPLYLDELGRSFDPVHRHNLIPTIKDLMDDVTYGQIFMISHYMDGQNSYPNTEIIVLDAAHVDIKRSYNEHVTIS